MAVCCVYGNELLASIKCGNLLTVERLLHLVAQHVNRHIVRIAAYALFLCDETVMVGDTIKGTLCV